MKSLNSRRRLNKKIFEEENKESNITRIQLKSILDNVQEVLNHLEGQHDFELEDWVQSKLSVAEDYLSTIQKYVILGEKKDDEYIGPIQTTQFDIADEDEIPGDGTDEVPEDPFILTGMGDEFGDEFGDEDDKVHVTGIDAITESSESDYWKVELRDFAASNLRGYEVSSSDELEELTIDSLKRLGYTPDEVEIIKAVDIVGSYVEFGEDFTFSSFYAEDFEDEDYEDMSEAAPLAVAAARGAGAALATRFVDKMGEAGEEDFEDEEIAHIKVKTEDGRYINHWWLKKIGDTTHFKMSNDPEKIERGWPYHIGEHRGSPYYDDVRGWLKGGPSPDGNVYQE